MKENKYTIIVRKSEKEYVAVCLELNVSARGRTIKEVEKNIRNAISDYKKVLKVEKDISVEPISSQELAEFIRDTKSKHRSGKQQFYSVKLNEVPLCG